MSSLFELLKKEQKVCIITTIYPPYPENVETFRGGVTEMQEQLYNERVENGMDVFVISLSLYGKSRDTDKVYRVGTYIPYGKSKFRRLMFPILEFFNPLIFFRLIRILNKENPSCIEYGSSLQFSIAPLVAALLLKKKVFVRNDWLCPNLYAKEHSCSDVERMKECANCLGITNIFLKPFVGLYSVLMLKLKRFLWNRCSGVIVQSSYHKQLLEGWGIKPEKMIMMPPTSVIYEDPIYTEELIKLKKDKIALVYIGRLTEEKGFDLLLDSFRRIKQKRSDVLLLVAGTGDLRRDMDDVEYLGWVEKDRLGSVYKVADIVVVPTVVPEAHPAVVDDALKYEKPVVAFRVGALEEMIGARGVLVEEISADALAEAVMGEMDR
ncbi:D-inositol-3-phosphate glycosyltransferase [ANME-1 cluster archaeon GoMg2]|nr:D-inositol-3-phosphate glycosyltransferase [ANME-1 cluster archaeon GoMg2]